MKIKGLSIFAIISFIIVLIINFTSWKLVCDTCKADKIEAIIENLCLSYIAGYIFYFLNIYLVERREKKHIMPYIASNVIRLISNNHTIIHNATGKMKFDFNWWLSEQEWKDYLSKTDYEEKVKFYFPKENWIYFINKRNKSTLNTIDKLLLTGKYLDEELRNLLFEIRESSFLNEDNNLFSDNILGKHYKTWFRFFDRVEKLKPYFDKNLKSYYKFDKYIG